MSNEYKRLKEELDSVDLDNILPGFDREASWKELSPRLKKTQNRTFAWRYAAALVAIIIAAVLVRMQMNKPNVEEQVVTTAPAVTTTPAIVDTKVTETQPRVEPLTEAEPPLVARKSFTRKSAPAHQTAHPQSQPLPVEEHIANTQPEPVQPEMTENIEQPVATAKPAFKRPKAIHLLDIDNENRQAVIQDRNELQSVTQRIVNLIPGRQFSNIDNERKPASLIKVN